MGFERGMGRRRRRRRTIVEGSGKVVMERERLTERPMREEKDPIPTFSCRQHGFVGCRNSDTLKKYTNFQFNRPNFSSISSTTRQLECQNVTTYTFPLTLIFPALQFSPDFPLSICILCLLFWVFASLSSFSPNFFRPHQRFCPKIH